MKLADMKRVLANGGSVWHGNRLIVTEADLPTAAELAKGDPVAEATTKQDLQAQIAALQAQYESLSQPAALKGGKAKDSGDGKDTA